MKIGINIQFVKENVGVGVTTRETLKELNRQKNNHEYILYYDRPLKKAERKTFFSLNLSPENFKIKTIPSQIGAPGSLKNKIAWESFTLPRAVQKDRIDLFFSPYASLSIIRSCPHLNSLLDLQYKVLPEPGDKKDYLGDFFHFLMERSIKRADKILTISENSKKEIPKFLKIKPGKIINISCGKSDLYKPLKPDKKAKAQKIIRKKFRVNPPYFFYLGSTEPRKNLDRTITAFADFLKNPKFKNYIFVFAGIAGQKKLSADKIKAGFTDVSKLADELKISKNIKQVGFISEEEKLYLLSNAEALVFPSIYEGFGLPPLEAMSVGCPVVTSDQSSLPEVVGNAALTVDPFKTPEIKKAMEKITEDQSLKTRLVKKGLIQSEKFSWTKTVNHLLKIIDQYQK